MPWDSIRDWIINNWFGELAFLLGLIALALSVAFYFWSKKERIPRYAVRSTNLIEGAKNRFPGLTVSYKGQGAEEHFSVARIVLWNAGNETIRDTDIVPGHPLTIVAKDGARILGASIIQHNEAANKFTCLVAHGGSMATISFQYFDKNHGIVIELLHTGLSPANLEITGKIMGSRPLKRITTESKNPVSVRKLRKRYRKLASSRLVRVIIGIVFLAGSIFLFAAPVLIYYIDLQSMSRQPHVTIDGEEYIAIKPVGLGPVAVLAAICYLPAFVYAFLAYFTLMRGIPRGLDKYEETML